MHLEEFTDADGRDDRQVVADPDAGPLRARFYEIGSNRPIFLNRDSAIHYSLKWLSLGLPNSECQASGDGFGRC